MSTDRTCLMCSAPSPATPCCSTDCLRAATRERDDNLRRLRHLRASTGSEGACAELTLRNGELTGALVVGTSLLRERDAESMA